VRQEGVVLTGPDGFDLKSAVEQKETKNETRIEEVRGFAAGP
jgi:hypothetical protein